MKLENQRLEKEWKQQAIENVCKILFFICSLVCIMM